MVRTYEPMREPLWLFQQRCKNRRLTTDLLKGYLGLLLRALDYIHSECHIIHLGEFEAAPDVDIDEDLLDHHRPQTGQYPNRIRSPICDRGFCSSTS